MSLSNPPPYVLQVLADLTDSINFPLENTHRIKYTCFDVSKNFIAFGATSGGIYVFSRTPCEFIQLIPNKDGTVTKISISPNEKHICCANGRGVVTISKCSQSLTIGETSVTCKEHQGNEVTSLAWSGNMVVSGDDVGRVAVTQLHSFMAMFSSSSQIIMNLDSRVCQVDTKDCMLLVSTLTRSYICDTSQEQYRQIGQKLRDGEYGACFVHNGNTNENGYDNSTEENLTTEVKQYNIVDGDIQFAVGEKFSKTLIICARPSSRLWEATIDGMVRRTHQFRQVLAKKPMQVITLDDYNSESLKLERLDSNDDGKSINFPKIYSAKSAIFSYTKDAFYFLNLVNNENTLWFNCYKDIVDCKLYNEMLYVWLSNGSLINLRIMKIDKFLVKCFLDEKYTLCSKLCALYSDYFLNNNISSSLHILTGLKKILPSDTFQTIEKVLEKFKSLDNSTEHKNGIYIVDNIFHSQALLDDDDLDDDLHDPGDNMFSTLTPEAIHAFKELSVSVSDKLSSSKKILKEKWEDLKQLSTDKQTIQEECLPKAIFRELELPNNVTPLVIDHEDIIFNKVSSQNIVVDENEDMQKFNEKVCKSLYQYYRLSVVGRESEVSNLATIIEDYSCDINRIYELMNLLKDFCLCIEAIDESTYVPNYIFLSYLNISSCKCMFLDDIISNETLYKYFVDSCLIVNMRTHKMSDLGCECGFPLPSIRTNKNMIFSEIIDDFLERQWLSESKTQCYEMCKRMPFLWRKILYLRRNEDLVNILRILLQLLDENLLHSFLPQFTLDVWDKAVQLYATLHDNICLNCNKVFDNVLVKDRISWDKIGILLIKSVGGRSALKVMEKHASLIEPGVLSVKFYHICLMTALYGSIDGTLTAALTDTLNLSFEYEDARIEICELLKNTTHSKIQNTALPLIIASKSTHWGLTPPMEGKTQKVSISEETEDVSIVRDLALSEIIESLGDVVKDGTDCWLCGLPLGNAVLMMEGGLWVFKCGHTYHGACLNLSKVKLCPMCV